MLRSLLRNVRLRIVLCTSSKGLNIRPSPSDRCMDYHLLSWKTKITASERGAPPGKKKGLFQMTDISPCVGTLWHG